MASKRSAHRYSRKHARLLRPIQKTGRSFNVVYVGMARGEKTGMFERITRHAKSKRKGPHWSHFSLFEVHDNISEQEVEELEGLFRHIYRKDKNANKFNKQKRHHKLFRIRQNNLKLWRGLTSRSS